MLFCTGLLLVAGNAAAAGPPPLANYFASADVEGPANGPYPPGNGLEGPCGAGVDSKGIFYIADYYHRVVDAFKTVNGEPRYLTQMNMQDDGTDNGPCGLALDSAGNLYVNDYHRDVVRYTPAAFPLATGTAYGPAETIDSGDPTGVAVDPGTGDVYVNDRTHIAVYEAPVQPEDQPQLEIGHGTLLDGYGLAFSSHSASKGRLYVADAATDTVKVYDPAIDTVNPVGEIDGADLPGGGFVSLRDSALAVDRVSGLIYVVDELLPEGYERPEAAVFAFDPAGDYAGRLADNVIDARPPGLAVDNSATGSQGRVYVTSGNTEGARVQIYGPGSVSKSKGNCAAGGPCPGGLAEASLAAFSSEVPAPAAASLPPPRQRIAAEVTQRANLRLELSGELSPHSLPRKGVAPVAVSVAGSVSTTDESQLPQLTAMRIELNRHGRLDLRGLPTCRYADIQPASSARALANCRSALVGDGSFSAEVILDGQEPYPTEGKLLVFNGRQAGKPVLYGQIYAPRPFATSFVIVFRLSRHAHGTYGTVLSATVPKALGSWGYLTGIRMRLARRFGHEGTRHSVLSAGCPAPEGISTVLFPLARASFRFADGRSIGSGLVRTCRAH
jgi:DNA-binding beta-propeller fold protein YncE